jgi:serine/threonine protein kinase
VRFPHKAGAYDLLEQIGQGAFGSVYKCRERATDRVLALKVLAKVQGEGPRRRFEREGEALARLDHPSIVRVHSAIWEGDHPHLAMELVEGEDLEQHLQREGRLAPEAARALLIPLADAVAHAHGRGVLHRDIKPSNVILSQDGRPMLLDFGLASLADSERLTLSGQMIGTPAFMAPEQARGKWDERTDVYGLGALLYAALTGTPPADGDNLAECLVQVMSGSPPDPRQHAPEIPSELAALCRRCLAKEPAERYASAQELAAALGALDMSPARPPGLWALALTAGLGLVGLAAALLAQQSSSPLPSPSLVASPISDPSPSVTLSPSPVAHQSPLSLAEWNTLLFSREVWTGKVDMERVRARTSPEHAGRPEVVAALSEVAGQVRRGAPWQELRATFARFYEAPPWEEVDRLLPILRARLLHERGRSVEALPLLEKSKDVGAAWIRFEIYARQGEEGKALQLLQLIAQSPDSVGELARARLARSQGDSKTALRLASKAARFHSAYLEKARALFELKRAEEGKAELARFLDHWGPTPEFLSLSAEVAIHEGDAPRALEFCKRAARLLEVDSDPGLSYQHGRALILAERWRDAQALLEAQVPPQRRGEALTSRQIPLIGLLGLAYYGLPETRTRAKEPWVRIHRVSPLLAQASLPPEASAAARAELTRVGKEVSGFKLDPEDQAALLRQLVNRDANTQTWLRPLGEIPDELATRRAVDATAPQALQDLQKARLLVARGRPWADVRFFLQRALEAGSHQAEVRPAWLRLALAREQDLELLEKRLQDDFARYGLDESSAALHLADVEWGQKRTGRAAKRYREVVERWPQSEAGKVAAATSAILRHDFAAVPGKLSGVESPRFAARAAALRGLAQIARSDFEAAFEAERQAKRVSGAQDARTLALRAALAAGVSGTLRSRPDQQLALAGWTARSLALRACLASGEPAKTRWAAIWLDRADDESAEALLLLGYAALLQREKIKGAQDKIDTAWRAARRRDPALPVPQRYLKRYAEAYGKEPDLNPR